MSIVSKATMRKVRSISPIIATIILIVITVVAGGFIYAYVSGMLRSGATSNVADVQSISLVPINDTAATLAVTIHNGGSVAITSVTLTSFNGKPANSLLINGNTSNYTIIKSIPPGSTGSNSVTINGTYLAGETYPIVLQVSFANHASQTISTSVPATSY